MTRPVDTASVVVVLSAPAGRLAGRDWSRRVAAKRHSLAVGQSGLLALGLVAIFITIDPRNWRIGAPVTIDLALAVAAFANFGRSTAIPPAVLAIGRSSRYAGVLSPRPLF